MSSTVSSSSSSSPTAPKLWTLLLMMSSSNSSNGGSSSRHSSSNKANKTKKTKTPPPPPPPKRHILSQLDPQSTTLRDLYDAAQQAFHDDIFINLRKNEELELQRDGIRMGQINRDDDETCTRLTLTNSPDINLVQAGLQSQDRILVVWKESKTNSNKKKIDKKKSAATAATAAFQKKTKTAAPKKKKKQHDEEEEESSEDDDDDDEGMTAAVASSTFTTRRPQRQAAAQATASFAETIRQQDELMMMQQQQQQKQQSKSSKRARTATSRSSRSSSRNNNHTRSLPPVKRSRHAAFSSTAGRRLHDGAEFVAGGAATTSTTTRRRPQKQAPKNTTFGDSSNTSEDPAVMALLEATSSAAATNTNTRQGRLMRAGWKQAVQNAVEQNKAVARLAAIASGKFCILVTTTATAASATATDNNKFTISFAKGVQGRGEYQDENVDALSVELLQSVLASIHPINPEALRPENLALLSPRVLWSIVYHHQEHQQQQHDDDDNTRQQGMDIVQALQTIQPNLDWSFLRRRKQQLSAKARENLRQKQQQQQDDWQAAADAIESVELAMGDLTSAFEHQQQQRQGILSATQPTMTTFTIVTPAETDLDELQDCMRDSASNMPEGARGTSLPEDLSSEYLQLAQDLVDTCNVHNWRELANCSDKIENLVETLKPKHSWLNDSIVQGWIDQAQLHSLDEIMVEICEGNTSAVEILRDAANSGTPKDLSVWRGIAGALREQLESSSVTGNNESDLPPEEQLAEWCERAYQAVESVEWLDWYATPIGD